MVVYHPSSIKYVLLCSSYDHARPAMTDRLPINAMTKVAILRVVMGSRTCTCFNACGHPHDCFTTTWHDICVLLSCNH